MSGRFSVLIPLTLLALGACKEGKPALDTDKTKASYGLGYQVGSQFQSAQAHIDREAFMAGFRDGLGGQQAALSDAEIQEAFQAMSALMEEEEMARRSAEGEKNESAGKAFQDENRKKEGVVVTESGLQYEVLRMGDGPKPGPQDQVSIHYRGTLVDGTQFDSSYDRGQPAVFNVSGVIPGFAEGLQLMPVGSRFRFVIPPQLGYGPQGAGGVIGPNATLVFEVELLEIVR